MEPPDLLPYYSRRAPEYEAIYAKPERQPDLARLAALVREAVEGKHVLEVACGTGYWTERYADVTRTVLATDASPEVLAVAERKTYPPACVRFALADAYTPMATEAIAQAAPFDAAVAAFWWSHVPRARLGGFLNGLHAALAPGASVWLCDNRYVEGSSTPIAYTDDAGDTFQRRRLTDGSTHDVLKNFPTPEVLRASVAGRAEAVEITELDYFWVLRYRVPNAPG